MPKNLWTREELMLVFNLYLKMSFAKMHITNKDVIHLANLIGKSPHLPKPPDFDVQTYSQELQARSTETGQSKKSIFTIVLN